MSDPRIDSELLAAFLDGTATPAERERVLQCIAGSREAYAEFMEASATRDELHAAASVAGMPEAATTGVQQRSSRGAVAAPESIRAVGSSAERPPAASRRRTSRLIAPVVVFLAAALAVVWMSRRRPEAERDVLTVAQVTRVPGAMGSGSLARVLGPEWDEPGWTVTRGADAPLSQRARAFRVGVGFAHLQLAANAGDSAGVGRTIAHLQRTLASVDGSAPLSSMLADLRESPAERVRVATLALPAPLSDLTGASAWFELGLWIGVGRAAAASGDAAFFASGSQQMRMLETLLERSGEPPPAWQEATGPLRTLHVLATDGPDVMRLRALAIERAFAAAAE